MNSRRNISYKFIGKLFDTINSLGRENIDQEDQMIINEFRRQLAILSESIPEKITKKVGKFVNANYNEIITSFKVDSNEEIVKKLVFLIEKNKSKINLDKYRNLFSEILNIYIEFLGA